VEVENAYNKLLPLQAEGGRRLPTRSARGVQEVGPSVFFCSSSSRLLFCRLALVDRRGRLFKPLATSKNHRHGERVPAPPSLWIPHADALHPHDPFTFKPRFLSWPRTPGPSWAPTTGGQAPHQPGAVRGLRAGVRFVSAPEAVIAAALGLVAVKRALLLQAGLGVHAALNEGTILYMPQPCGHLRAQARDLLVTQDRSSVLPEVRAVVFGKAASGDLDRPAPFSMMETRSS